MGFSGFWLYALITLLLLAFILAAALIIIRIKRKQDGKSAKENAYRLFNEHNPDPARLEQIIKVLSASQDEEAKVLVQRLVDKRMRSEAGQ